ncbi:MoaD/ThiS family protein [Opitutaceae bacterium]|jgi:molybdopterin converting factor subunit 1|nr:MoaD/ThiS family protein [Opitutaceae bacterium]
MKSITVKYFAILREQRGEAEESLNTDAPDAQTLYEELQPQHGFTLPVDRLRAAVNGEFQPWPAPLNEGDEVVFIPPVAGG